MTASLMHHSAELAAMLRIAGPAVRSTAAIGKLHDQRSLQ
jgi:hypothetical protein